jgi:Zn-dependent protease
MIKNLLKTFPLFTFMGIPTRVHWSFIAFFILLAFLLDPLSFMIITVAFLSIIPHEYGHALAARHYGIKTHSIVMLPIGGMAFIEEMPKTPWKELVITGAGPAVTLLIALLGLPFLVLIPNYFFAALVISNLFLFAINIVPCLPMDGGRIFRALLHYKYDYKKSTIIAARTSQVLCVLFVGLAVFTMSPMLAITMGVIFYMAQKELEAVA